jgi:hypothetical protein
MPPNCFALHPVDDLLCVVSILVLILWSFYYILELFRQCGICFSFYPCNCIRALFEMLLCYRRLGHSRYCHLLCATLSGFYIRHRLTIFTQIKINIYFLITTNLKSWMDNNWLCTIIVFFCFCSLVLFLFVHCIIIVLFTASDQPVGIFKLFFLGKFYGNWNDIYQ